MMITVVTTLYKGKKYLDSLLSNIQQNALGLKKSHTEVDVEYIIVNDYPTEKIRINDEIRAFEVIVIENENNCGIHESRAKAVNRARGEFIQFLDQDDHLADNALLSQFENIGSADVGVANGYESYNGELTAFYKNLRVQKLALKKIFYYYVGNQIVSPGQCLIRKESIPQAWLSNFMRVNCSDDYLLWLIMMEANKEFVLNPTPLFYHEITGENISGKFETKFKSNLEMCEITKNTGSLSDKSLKRIKSFTTAKCLWKKTNNKLEKANLILKSTDVFFWNAVYKIMTF